MRKLYFAAGLAVGYVLGTRAGRQRYEQIAATARRVRDNPTVRDVTGKLQDQAEQAAEVAREKIMTSGVAERLFGEHAEGDDAKPRYWETTGTKSSTKDSSSKSGGSKDSSSKNSSSKTDSKSGKSS